jgi:hypothetical protein
MMGIKINNDDKKSQQIKETKMMTKVKISDFQLRMLVVFFLILLFIEKNDLVDFPFFKKYVEMLKNFKLTNVWYFAENKPKLRDLRGKEKWILMKCIFNENDNYLQGIFKEVKNVVKVNQVINKI